MGRRLLEDPRVRPGLTVLMVPPFVSSWADRAEVARLLDELREALVWMPPRHPAEPELLNAALRIDGWLSRWPAEPERDSSEPELCSSWNDDVATALVETWQRIEPLFVSRTSRLAALLRSR